MKPSPHENPDLTAYALGELHARQAREIHDLLAACPVATHDLEQIEAVTDALRQSAPIPQERLRPEQRHAVLYPANLPRRMGPMMPRPAQRRPSVLWPVMTGILKAAALVAVTGGAYLVGRQAGIGTDASTVVADTAVRETVLPEESDAPVPEKAVVAAPPSTVPVETVEAALESSPALPEKAPVLVVASPAAEEREPVQKLKPEAPKVAAAKPAPVVAASRPRPLPLTTPGKHTAFVSASRHPVDQFALRPALIRPLPAKINRKQLLAAPLPHVQPAPEVKETSKPRTPDIYIHSWQAEVASCPWNEGHRLLRVAIQLPADQPAAASQASYPLRVSFDPNCVREYRQLCERHQPAAELRNAGTHVVWYEFLPNGSMDENKTVATVTLDKSRFTTQAVGPFDSSKLEVQDRGQSWENARESFVFDSAVVGFGLLMQGAPATPGLDHDLVLTLAEKPKGPDTNGDRARFIKLVREAAGAAGL